MDVWSVRVDYWTCNASNHDRSHIFMIIMDVFDVNWKTVAEFYQNILRQRLSGVGFPEKATGRLLVVFSTLLNFNGLRMWNMDVSEVN